MDVERISSLPILEFMDAIDSLTDEQYEELLSRTTLVESVEAVRPIISDELDEYVAKHSMIFTDIDDMLDEIKNKKK